MGFFDSFAKGYLSGELDKFKAMADRQVKDDDRKAQLATDIEAYTEKLRIQDEAEFDKNLINEEKRIKMYSEKYNQSKEFIKNNIPQIVVSDASAQTFDDNMAKMFGLNNTPNPFWYTIQASQLPQYSQMAEQNNGSYTVMDHLGAVVNNKKSLQNNNAQANITNSLVTENGMSDNVAKSLTSSDQTEKKEDIMSYAFNASIAFANPLNKGNQDLRYDPATDSIVSTYQIANANGDFGILHYRDNLQGATVPVDVTKMVSSKSTAYNTALLTSNNPDFDYLKETALLKNMHVRTPDGLVFPVSGYSVLQGGNVQRKVLTGTSMPAFLKYIEGALGNNFTGDQFTKTTTQGAPFESDMQTQYGLLDYALDMDQLSKAYNLEFFEDSERVKDIGKALDPYDLKIVDQNRIKTDAFISGGYVQDKDFKVTGATGSASDGTMTFAMQDNIDKAGSSRALNSTIINAFGAYTKQLNSSESAYGAVSDTHRNILNTEDQDITISQYADRVGAYHKSVVDSLRSDIKDLSEAYENNDNAVELIIEAMNNNVPEEYRVSALTKDTLGSEFIDNLAFRYIGKTKSLEDLSQFDTYQQGIRELTEERNEAYNSSVIQKYFPDQPKIGFEVNEDNMGSDFENIVKSFVTTSDDDDQLNDLYLFLANQSGVEFKETENGVQVISSDEAAGNDFLRLVDQSAKITDALPKFIEGQSTTQSDNQRGEGFPKAIEEATKEKIDPEKDAIDNWLNQGKVLSVSEIEEQEGVSNAEARAIWFDQNGSAFNTKYDLSTGYLKFKDPEKPNHVLPRNKYQGAKRNLWDELYSKSHNEDGTPKTNLNEVFD